MRTSPKPVSSCCITPGASTLAVLLLPVRLLL